MNAVKNKLFAKYGHLCEVTSSWEDLYMFQGSPNIITQIRRAWTRFRMASEVNSRCNFFLKSQKGIEAEHRRQMQHLHIIHPFSGFRKHWEMLMIFVFTTVFIIIPLDLASLECPIIGHLNDNQFWKWLRTIFDFCCLSDVVVNFFTGYCDVDSRRVIMEPKRIALRYSLTFFIPDLLSSIPTHLEAFFQLRGTSKGTYRSTMRQFFQYSAFFKLARFISFYIYSKRLAEAYDVSYAIYRVVLSLMLYVIHFHIFTCLNLAYVGMNLEAVQIARSQNSQSAKYEEDNTTVTFFAMYARVFYETSHVLLTSSIGFDTNRMTKEDQKVIITGTWFISKIIFFYVVSQLISVISSVRASNIKYREMVRQLREYMRYRQLPESLQRRLITYYEFRFQKSYFRETEIFNSVSGQLRQEIIMHGCRQLVENVEFFKNLPMPLIIRIVSALDPDVYMVNDVIIKVNTAATCMYFIASGCVAVYTKSGHEVCHLEDGNFFGEIALVDHERLRLASVVAVETCELYKLDKQDFVRAILPYPDLMTKIRKIAHYRTEETEFVEERSAQQRQTIRNLKERH